MYNSVALSDPEEIPHITFGTLVSLILIADARRVSRAFDETGNSCRVDERYESKKLFVLQHRRDEFSRCKVLILIRSMPD